MQLLNSLINLQQYHNCVSYKEKVDELQHTEADLSLQSEEIKSVYNINNNCQLAAC